MSGLHEAAEKGDATWALALIDADPSLINAEDAEGATPLHYAALNDSKDVVELLLAKGSKVNARDNAGQTPLHYASSGEIAALLIAEGADVDARDNKGRSPLHRAARNRQQVVMGYLLASGAQVDAVETEYGWTPLHYAASKQAASLLVANGADVNARDSKDRTPLHRAAENGYEAVVDFLVSKGANVNDRDNEGWTPMHYAARWHGNTEMVRILLSHGGDITAVNRFGMTPAHLAAWHGHKDIVAMLRKHGDEAQAA